MIAHILLQDVATFEVRTVLGAVMLLDNPPLLTRCALNRLGAHEDALRAGTAMAIGSVEFVRKAFELAGIVEPPNMTYPPELEAYFGRDLRQVQVSQVLGSPEPCFVKPLETKAFTGFVYQPGIEMDEHDREQLSGLKAMAPDALVWTCEPLWFVSEWRYYLRAGKVVGMARYDEDGPDSAPSPNMQVISAAAAQLVHTGPCALDFGVLEDGRALLIEANDFWALGLYGAALEKKLYLSLLQERWQEMALCRLTDARVTQ